MGMFGMEKCALYRKKVGALNRNRLLSGECVCSECRKKTHEFARPEQLTLDELRDLVSFVPEMEKAFDAADKTETELDMGFGRRLVFCSTGASTREFAFVTPETRRYGHKCVFSFSRIGSASVSLEEKKSGGKAEGYYLVFPYEDKAIRSVRIDLEQMSEEDARGLAEQINRTRAGLFPEEHRDTPANAKEETADNVQRKKGLLGNLFGRGKV